jgi:hypothetical protein
MHTYPNNLSTLFFELPFYLLTCLLTQQPTYILTYLPMHPPSYLPLCFLYNQIPNSFSTHFFQHPPYPTYQFIKVHPNSWMMNIGPHMWVLQTIYNGNNVIIIVILV